MGRHHADALAVGAFGSVPAVAGGWWLVAGDETGMPYMLEQFGPALKLPWTKLEAPELNDILIDRMVEGTQACEQSIRELEALRDNCLVRIMEALSKFEMGPAGCWRSIAHATSWKATAGSRWHGPALRD
ncbi:hypothetical protein [Microbulbifer sp. YPW16]|uniref:hypothetical protein n=1 Tax=Microbulbifer sp. YPW16 TaxID=2904242 RepID=UPI001E3197C8|nr:hypothetical protein [Microbulbifer sp. YPW16]UHQ55436.1 hypothetical protein LVE68_00160 [Microbulbifer sp. YPW16]